jgi:hypothetical protein
MEATMVIPSYWGRESSIGWQKGDAIYDHPTPLDQEGTLQRALESTAVLEDTDFKLAILAVPTSDDIAEEVEERVSSIIQRVQPHSKIEIILFGQSHLSRIHSFLNVQGKGEYLDLLSLRGYSPVRNLCLFLPHILGSEIAVLIDDDEVFEDPRFMSKAREFIGSTIDGKEVNAVAGYYLQPDGNYLLKKPFLPWMRYWDKYSKMDEAFVLIIGAEPRLKETPFVFGGNMVVHRNLFTTVPFDPNVTRGEDIDFLINARMFGFSFFLDNQLSIKHLAPPKSHSTWMQIREDIYRFVYERSKIESQRDVQGMKRVVPGDFDPYPGCFFRSDLEDKVEKACRLLSEEYSSQGQELESKESLYNTLIVKSDAIPEHDPFQKLCSLQKAWKGLMEYSSNGDISSKMREIIDVESGM